MDSGRTYPTFRTVCHYCNATAVTVPGETLLNADVVAAAQLRDREIQIQSEAYNGWLRSKKVSSQRNILVYLEKWQSLFPDTKHHEPNAELVGALKQFQRRLVEEEIFTAMDLAKEKYPYTDNADYVMKYFFGICWKKIKGGDIDVR